MCIPLPHRFGAYAKSLSRRIFLIKCNYSASSHLNPVTAQIAPGLCQIKAGNVRLVAQMTLSERRYDAVQG